MAPKIRGMDDFTAFLRVMNDPGHYQKLVGDLQKQADRAESALKDLKLGRDLQAAQAKAAKLRTQAEEDLHTAREAAEQMVNEAEASATRALDEVTASAGRVDQEQKLRAEELDARQQKIEARERQLAKIEEREQSVSKREEDVGKLLARAQEIQQDYEARNEALKTALQSVH